MGCTSDSVFQLASGILLHTHPFPDLISVSLHQLDRNLFSRLGEPARPERCPLRRVANARKKI